MTNDKWQKRWVVPSSSGDGNYIVGQDAEGNYGCSCPGWTRQVRKLCPDCRSLAIKAPGLIKGTTVLVCPVCHKVVETPIIERRNCRHINEVTDGKTSS